MISLPRFSLPIPPSDFDLVIHKDVFKNEKIDISRVFGCFQDFV